MSAPPNVPPPPPGATSVVYYVYTMGHNPHGPQSTNPAFGCCSPLAFIKPFLIFLNWALWVIFIAGACQLMSKCNNYAFNNIGFGPIVDIYPTPFGGVADCSNYYGLLWWAVWLEFICIALSTLLALRFIWPKVDAAFTLTVYFFMMSSILLFSVAYTYTTSVYVSASKNSGSFSFTSGTSLVCAGSIGNLILNFIYIIWTSWVHVPTPPTWAPKAVPSDVKSFPIEEVLID